MNPFVFGMKEPEHGWLDSATHELIQLARQEAELRGLPEVSLEHLLLGTLVQNNIHVVSLFVVLGLDPISLRERILERLGPLQDRPEGVKQVPLSEDLQLCLDQAVAAVHSVGITFVLPEHLLLCVLSNQWQLASDKLVERLSATPDWECLLPMCVELAHQERRMMFYIQNLVHFLSCSRESAISFSHIPGLDPVKKALRALITRIEELPDAQHGEKRKPHEILLLGSPYTSGRLLAEACAFAMDIRLLSFSFAGLVAMCTPFTTYGEVKRLKDQGFSVRANHFSLHGAALAQQVLQRFFFRAHHMFPCLLLIEDIDVSEYAGRTRVDDIRDRLLAFVFAEIEKLSVGGQTIILATAALEIDIALQRLAARGLLHTPHFEHKLFINSKENTLPAIPWVLCPSCAHKIEEGWKHCAECGCFLN